MKEKSSPQSPSKSRKPMRQKPNLRHNSQIDQKPREETLLELEIEKIVSGGFGLARLNGQVVFVKNALPSEKVRAQVIERKKDLIWAEVVEILEKSPLRIEPACPYFTQCGGCDFQHLNLLEQQKFKIDILKDNLRRIGKIDYKHHIPIHSQNAWGYRSRAKIQVNQNGQKGFFSAESHQINPIEQCLTFTPELNDWVKSAQVQAGSYPLFSGHIQGQNGVHFSKDFEVTVLNKNFHLNHKVFFQSNLELLPQLIQYVMPQSPVGLAVDLYSGVGLFAAFLEDYAQKVIAVEREKECLRLAKKNLNLNKSEFYTGNSENWVQENPNLNPDYLIVDPPRAGLDSKVIEQIRSWKVQKMAYVSCNPDTFARDLARFEKAGYRVDDIQAFDFYPQTTHLEVAALLSLNPEI